MPKAGFSKGIVYGGAGVKSGDTYVPTSQWLPASALSHTNENRGNTLSAIAAQLITGVFSWAFDQASYDAATARLHTSFITPINLPHNARGKVNVYWTTSGTGCATFIMEYNVVGIHPYDLGISGQYTSHEYALSSVAGGRVLATTTLSGTFNSNAGSSLHVHKSEFPIPKENLFANGFGYIKLFRNYAAGAGDDIVAPVRILGIEIQYL